MAELIQTYAEVVRDAGGEEYTVHAYGEAREDGNWEGWIEFHSTLGAVRRTNREALAYWASGLEPVYFDGAFARAS
jgi:hypothetical protein